MRLNSESGFRNRAYGIASKPQEAVKTEDYTDDGSASMDALKEDLKQYYESLGKYVEVGNYRPEEGRIGFYLTVSKSRSNPKIDVISFFYNTNTGKYVVTYNRDTKFFTDTESLKKYTKGLRLKTESARKCEALKLRIESANSTKIEVENPGVLEVPEGKNVDDLPLSHFVKLANKKGLSKITRALNNLQVWNKNDDPKLSKWAGDMIDKLKKKLGKEESIRIYTRRR